MFLVILATGAAPQASTDIFDLCAKTADIRLGGEVKHFLVKIQAAAKPDVGIDPGVGPVLRSGDGAGNGIGDPVRDIGL